MSVGWRSLMSVMSTTLITSAKVTRTPLCRNHAVRLRIQWASNSRSRGHRNQPWTTQPHQLSRPTSDPTPFLQFRSASPGTGCICNSHTTNTPVSHTLLPRELATDHASHTNQPLRATFHVHHCNHQKNDNTLTQLGNLNPPKTGKLNYHLVHFESICNKVLVSGKFHVVNHVEN